MSSACSGQKIILYRIFSALFVNTHTSLKKQKQKTKQNKTKQTNKQKQNKQKQNKQKQTKQNKNLRANYVGSQN